MVEAKSYVTGDFNVLPLVVANRYFGRIVEQDVCSLEGWVGKEPSRYKIRLTLC